MQIRLYLDEDAMDNDLVRALRMRLLSLYVRAASMGKIAPERAKDSSQG